MEMAALVGGVPTASLHIDSSVFPLEQVINRCLLPALASDHFLRGDLKLHLLLLLQHLLDVRLNA